MNDVKETLNRGALTPAHVDRVMYCTLLPLLVLVGCQATPPNTGAHSGPSNTTDTSNEQGIGVIDVTDFTAIDHSLSSGFVGEFEGHFERGRSCAPGDFDGDGRLDLVLGNPGDTTYILLNKSEGPGHFLWERGQTLSTDKLTWGIGAADLDNDGDPDVVMSNGGNESRQFNQLFRNNNGVLVDITPAEVAGPLGNSGLPMATTTAGVLWADFNNDAQLDLFLSTFIGTDDERDPNRPYGVDQLLLGDGAGAYTATTFDARLFDHVPTMNAVAFDSDNDGWTDLFQNVLNGGNSLWLNDGLQGQTTTFTDYTREASGNISDAGLAVPFTSFSSAAADLNHDGLMDMVVWQRGPSTNQFPHEGHMMWIQTPQGYVDVAQFSGINNNREVVETQGMGVMGSQLGDLNLDGIPDVFTGTGGPATGNLNELWISTGLKDIEIEGVGVVRVPIYADMSRLIRTPIPGTESVPFPYRTHGACIADYDGDGRPELAFVNGGPSYFPDVVQEPNRLFSFVSKVPNHFVNVRAIGNGVTSNRDGIGAKIEVRVEMADGEQQTFHAVRLGGNGFSSQNGPELIVGLGQAVSILSSTLIWPDGERQNLVLEMDEKVVVTQQ